MFYWKEFLFYAVSCQWEGWVIIPSLSTGGFYPQQRWSEDTQRNIEDHRRACSCPQSTNPNLLAVSILQQGSKKKWRLQDRPPKKQEKPVKAYLYNSKLINNLQR